MPPPDPAAGSPPPAARRPAKRARPEGGKLPAGQSRYWTAAENARFEAALREHDQDYAAIARAVGTRSTAQVRTHLTKYFNKLVRDVNRLHHNRNKRAKTAGAPAAAPARASGTAPEAPGTPRHGAAGPEADQPRAADAVPERRLSSGPARVLALTPSPAHSPVHSRRSSEEGSHVYCEPPPPLGLAAPPPSHPFQGLVTFPHWEPASFDDLDLLLSGYDLSAADDRELNQLLDFAGPAPPLPPPPKVAPAAAANADVIDTGHRMMDLLLDI